jgi:hypothetical protein
MWDDPDIANIPGFATVESANGLFADVLGQLELGLNFSVQANSNNSYHSRRPEDIAHRNLRDEAIRIVTANQMKLWRWLEEPSEPREGKTAAEIDAAWETLIGIRMTEQNGMGSIAPSQSALHPPKGEARLTPAISVNSARIARRQGPDGQELHQLIVQVTQRRYGLLDADLQDEWDKKPMSETQPQADSFFWFRGGATLVVDLRDGRLRRVIRKRIDDNLRLQRNRAFLLGDPVSMAMASPNAEEQRTEPFAMVHRS